MEYDAICLVGIFEKKSDVPKVAFKVEKKR